MLSVILSFLALEISRATALPTLNARQQNETSGATSSYIFELKPLESLNFTALGRRDVVNPGLLPGTGGYFTNVLIGKTPIPLVLDTASDITWIPVGHAMPFVCLHTNQCALG